MYMVEIIYRLASNFDKFCSVFENMPPVMDVIRGQANHVMRCLGRGHSENIYHRALITAMNKAGISHRSEVSCPIWFMGECIGVGRADMVIDDVVIEIKANRLPPKQTSAQLQKYLISLSRAESKTFRGIVVNFNQRTGLVDIFQNEEKSVNESALFKKSVMKSLHHPMDNLDSLKYFASKRSRKN